MLKSIAKKILYRARASLGLDEILEEVKLKNMIDITNLSAVGQFLFSHYKYFKTGHYHWHYPEWRMRRIRKILEIYGVDFRDKKILEIGGGLGDIGAFFAELGADVLSLEARACNRNIANLKYADLNNFKSVECDLERDFSNLGRFDLIINFGALEVIQNVAHVLECCIKLSDDIVLETMVCDSSDQNKIIFVDLDPEEIDHPIRGISARPSPAYIENFFIKNKFSVTQYFTPDLNTSVHIYDWVAKNDNSVISNRRRFWRFKKKIK